MVTEVMALPSPSAAACASSPVVHRAYARGMRWNASPAPSKMAMSPKSSVCRRPLLLCTKSTPVVMTVMR